MPVWKSKLNDGSVVVHIGSCSGTTEDVDHVTALLAAHGVWAGMEGSKAYTIMVRESEAQRAKEMLRNDPRRELFRIRVYPDS